LEIWAGLIQPLPEDIKMNDKQKLQAFIRMARLADELTILMEATGYEDEKLFDDLVSLSMDCAIECEQIKEGI